MSDLLKGINNQDSFKPLAKALPKPVVKEMTAPVAPSLEKKVNSRPSNADTFLSKLNNETRKVEEKVAAKVSEKPVVEAEAKSVESSSLQSEKPIASPLTSDLSVKVPVQSSPAISNVNSASELEDEVVLEVPEGEQDSVALATFLIQMEKELKVKPEELMKAFTELSDEDLTKAPEENVEKLVQMLNLNPEQKVKAEKFFFDMLKNSENNSFGDYLKQSNQAVGMEVMTGAQLQQKQQLAKLDQMNKDFFIDNKSAQTQELTSKLNKKMGAEVYQNQIAQAGPVAESREQQAIAAPVAAKSSMKAGAVASDWTPAPELPVKAEIPQVIPQQTKVVDPKVLPQVVPPQALAQVGKPVQAAMSEEQQIEQKIQEILGRSKVGSSANQVGDTTAKTAAPIAAVMAALGMESENKENNDSQNSDASQDFSQVIGFDQKANQPANTEKSMFQAHLSKPTETQAAQNLNEVVQNARLIAEKGGGEMRIEMKPEGMGELHLKVAVKNGHVNVEMITESNEAKKMIEKGLGELKSTLAAQKLNVEGIKVDVSNNTNNELQQQFQNAEKQMAQQFLQDFKRDNNNWRRQFTDGGEVKGPKSQIESGSDQAIQRLQAQSKKTGSRRLDLVA